MRRVTSEELLDHDLGTPQEVARSLDDLWWINRRLGGVSNSLRMLENFLNRAGLRRARILDVGAGDGRLAARLEHELRGRGRDVRIVAVDRNLSHITARDGGAAGPLRVVGDALVPPFAPGSFDAVMCNLFFHHFSGGAAVRLLQKLGETARRAVLVNDLERHLLAYLFIRVASPFAGSRITRHDGPVSVRQAYTRAELERVAREAGFSNFELRRVPPFRLALTLWKPAN